MFIIPWQEAIPANATSRLQIRTATERDLDRLVEYFRTLSRSSRYNRFMELDSNFANFAFQRVVQRRGADRFILIAEVQQQGRGAIIGEASYAVESETGRGQFALSVGHAWHGRGVGSALLSALQSRAIRLGCFAPVRRDIKDKRADEGACAKSRLRIRQVERLARDQI